MMGKRRRPTKRERKATRKALPRAMRYDSLISEQIDHMRSIRSEGRKG